MVGAKRCTVVVMVLAICGQMVQCTPAPDEQENAPPVEGTPAQAGNSSTAEGETGGVDAEGRSCGTCGITPHNPPVITTHDLGNFGLPGNFELPDIFGKLQDIKIWTVIGLAIPILVLQIITLSIVAYLLKIEKSAEEDTGSGTGGYYAAYPIQASGGYNMDSYSSYRSLMPSQDTMTWVLEKLSTAVDLYHDYQDQQNAI